MKYYIGKHSGELSDMGTKYFTSSNSFRNFFKKNVKDFDVKIVRVFDKCEDALAFERKYLIRVNASASELFFNKCNSGSNGKYDNAGLVHATLKENNLKVTVSKEYYHSHKNEFKLHESKGKVVAVDRNTGKYVKVDKSVFDDNSNLIGVNSLHPEIYEQCPYCKKDITIQNIKVHVKTHEKNTVWVTDGYNIFKCKEHIYYLYIKDVIKKFYLVNKSYKINNNFKVPYEGEMMHIRYIGRLRKNCYINEFGEEYESCENR